MKPVRRVLVIKLSALGDVVLAFPAFQRIRAAHRDAHITLLTTPPFESLARASPFFDAVETDGRPRSARAWLRLIGRLRAARYDRVYDLQTNDRTNLMLQMLRPRPPAWSGTAWGCALPDANPRRMKMHTLERQAQQLAMAGVWPDAPTAPGAAPPPDLSWIVGRSIATAASRDLVLLVPGASALRPEKRWPAEAFGELAARLTAAGRDVAVIGARQETPLAAVILARAPLARDLTGQTDFAQIARLGAGAALAVGNDTGPMHLIAAAGAPSLVLFSAASDPALCAPRGRVRVLRRAALADLDVESVWAAAMALPPRAEIARAPP